MRTIRSFVALVLFLVNVSSAISGEDDFAGCYSLGPDNEPLLKIEKIDDIYSVSLRDNRGWQEGTRLHPGTPQELAEIFETDGARIKSSLIADKGLFALFHVQAGETYAQYKAESDYITYILIGSSSAYKKACTD